MNIRFNFDLQYLKQADYVIGTDEAGRGAGAGPVFAAAVCFKSIDNNIITLLENINDSKQLSVKTREQLFDILTQNTIYSIYSGSVKEIENLNILKTSLLTMKKCVEEVSSKIKSDNKIVLVDGNKKIPNLKLNQETIVKGDFKSAAIAAASILAKVSRDRFMQELDKEFPQYGWSQNKGYITKEHINAIDKYGFTLWHRKTFFEKYLTKSAQLQLFSI